MTGGTSENIVSTEWVYTILMFSICNNVLKWSRTIGFCNKKHLKFFFVISVIVGPKKGRLKFGNLDRAAWIGFVPHLGCMELARHSDAQ